MTERYPSQPERQGDANLDLYDLLERHGVEPDADLIDALAANREKYLIDELSLIAEQNTQRDMSVDARGVGFDVLRRVMEAEGDE